LVQRGIVEEILRRSWEIRGYCLDEIISIGKFEAIVVYILVL